jgi:hypothetical protein
MTVRACPQTDVPHLPRHLLREEAGTLLRMAEIRVDGKITTADVAGLLAQIDGLAMVAAPCGFEGPVTEQRTGNGVTWACPRCGRVNHEEERHGTEQGG